MSDDHEKLDNAVERINHETFRKTQAQLETIAFEIRQEQPLASPIKSMEELRKSYVTDSNFDKGVSILANEYNSVRTIRGDGNVC